MSAPMPLQPRTYWVGLSDEQLIAARVEYLKSSDPEIRQVADDIWDDLARRADFRRRRDAA